MLRETSTRKTSRPDWVTVLEARSVRGGEGVNAEARARWRRRAEAAGVGRGRGVRSGSAMSVARARRRSSQRPVPRRVRMSRGPEPDCSRKVMAVWTGVRELRRMSARASSRMRRRALLRRGRCRVVGVSEGIDGVV